MGSIYDKHAADPIAHYSGVMITYMCVLAPHMHDRAWHREIMKYNMDKSRLTSYAYERRSLAEHGNWLHRVHY
jgi:hypothetical protein